MSCSSRIGVPNYDFFDNIPTYLINVEKANKDASELNTDDNCVSFSKQHTINNTDIGKQICEQFIKLCKQLPNIKNYNITDPNYRKDWDFLSYWLNFKLEKSKLNGTICPKKFYDGMENHCINTLLRFVTSTNLIYNINDEDISRMNVLYILHGNYSQLDKIINDSTPPKPESLLELSSTCSDNYIKAKYMCYGNYNKFCEKLKDFKTKYDNLFKTAESKGEKYTNNFKKLTDYDNINIISTTVIGSAVGLIPLLGILYKFTPIGQIFNSQKRKLHKDHSNNIDEIIKTSLLNYENEQLNLNQDKYNIDYQPTGVM
ncbi:PIR protein [Plasmodium vivax]|uniref:VIR protein n=1 Tax=Plasmodium vivax TaxID=5855 RepID=A0A565A522_PLAVI|nr:PIR protein [Plasmodium vivax]